MTWFFIYTACIFLLWVFSAPRDRSALRVLLIAAVCSGLLVVIVTQHIAEGWKLVIPGAVETLTILALLRWARTRTGYLQGACLLVAWLAHALCYLDLIGNTDLVYSRYETILELVAVAQILVCFETLARCGGLIASWVGSFRIRGGRGLRVAGVYHSVLHGKAAEVLQTAGRTEKSSRV